MTDKKTDPQTTDLVTRRNNPYQLDTNLAPVDWKSMRERFDPQGVKVAARELVGQTFTITEYRPVESSFPTGGVFYFVKGLQEDTGELFNTTLGGQAIVEVLNSFDALRSAYQEAVNFGDDARAAELAALGANAPLRVTLAWVAQGKYEGYYVFE